MTRSPDDWTLNNISVIFIAASADRVWEALTNAEVSPHIFMGSLAQVGDEGGHFALLSKGRLAVTGKVLIRQAPSLLRTTWVVSAPTSAALPNCEIEYRIEPAETPAGQNVVKLTVSEFVDGPVAPPFRRAGQTGWALIVSNIKSWAETGSPMPAVRLNPPT